MVFELMDRNMYEWIKDRKHYLQETRVKHHIYQILKVLDHIHRTGVFHRDIKPENILLREETVKLADFGSCRGTMSKQPYTEYISTRWYRSPECLLTDGFYDYKMDIWGVGCIFFEVMALHPLFPGKNELDMVHQIHRVLGTPPPTLLADFQRHATHMEFDFPYTEGTGLDVLLPHMSPEGVTILGKMLMYDSTFRPTAKGLLKSAYFRDIREQDMALTEIQIVRPVHFRTSQEENDGGEHFAQTLPRIPVQAKATVELPSIHKAYKQKFKVKKSGLEIRGFGKTRKFPSPVKRNPDKVYI